MKKILLISALSLLTLSAAFSSAIVEIRVQQEGGVLQVINDTTKAGFIEYGGGKNAWSVKYMADPGTYTVTGKNPGCPVVVQSSTFEEGKPYRMELTEDCRIQNFSL